MVRSLWLSGVFLACLMTIDPGSPAADEPPATGHGRIAGRVVVGDGRPAGGVEVVVLLAPPKGQSYYIGKLPLRRTTADAAGAFAFKGLAPGRHRVWANLGHMTSRPQRGRGEVVIVPEAGAVPGPVELRLAPAVQVIVRVTEKASGKPIAGATVQPGWSDFIDDFTTDRDGRVSAGPFTRERWRLDVWAPGLARQSRWFDLAGGQLTEADFQLEPGGDLEGVVRFLQAGTDARGILEFNGVPRGTEVELAWWGKGIGPGRADHVEQHAEDREGWFDITLSPPARIVGRVDRTAYATAGRIDLGGPIGILDSRDIELKPGQSDFAFEDLAPGDYTVSLGTALERDPDDANGLTNKTLATSRVTVRAGETATVDFRP